MPVLKLTGERVKGRLPDLTRSPFPHGGTDSIVSKHYTVFCVGKAQNIEIFS